MDESVVAYFLHLSSYSSDTMMMVHTSDGTVHAATDEEKAYFSQGRERGVPVSMETMHRIMSDPIGSRQPTLEKVHIVDTTEYGLRGRALMAKTEAKKGSIVLCEDPVFTVPNFTVEVVGRKLGDFALMTWFYLLCSRVAPIAPLVDNDMEAVATSHHDQLRDVNDATAIAQVLGGSKDMQVSCTMKVLHTLRLLRHSSNALVKATIPCYPIDLLSRQITGVAAQTYIFMVLQTCRSGGMEPFLQGPHTGITSMFTVDDKKDAIAISISIGEKKNSVVDIMSCFACYRILRRRMILVVNEGMNLPIHAAWAIFPYISVANHSCRPNCALQGLSMIYITPSSLISYQ